MKQLDGRVMTGGARAVSGPPKKDLATRLLTGRASQAERRAAVAGQAGQAFMTREVEGQAAANRPPGSLTVPRPGWLTKEEGRTWDRLAPHALAAHTLTLATADDFGQLVRLVVRRDRVWHRIQHDGMLVKLGKGKDAHRRRHPLSGDWQWLIMAVRNGMMRYRLAAIGREMEMVEPPKPDDPWAAFDPPAPGEAVAEETEDAADAGHHSTAH